jgi:VIT1/CCC1 family predicted Fe2+/Mn2+ transporter
MPQYWYFNSISIPLVILLTTPFGWIGGQLSEINRALPFVLLIGLFLIGIALTAVAGRLAGKAATAEA